MTSAYRQSPAAGGARRFLSSIGLPALLGAVTVFGFAPFNFFYIPILTFASLVILWLRSTGRGNAALIGLSFGLGLFCVGMHWIYISLHDFGGMPAPLAVFCTFLLGFILACFPALTGWAQSVFRVPTWVRVCIVIPALWTLFEWLRGWVFTGLPWLALGYTQAPTGPLADYAPLVGVFGVTLILTFIAGTIGLMFNGAFAGLPPKTYFILGVLLLVACLPLPWLLHGITWTRPEGKPISVSLLQGNITQDIKWKPETIASTLQTYRSLILASTSKLVITPETAFPIFLDQLPEELIQEVSNHARSNGSDLLVGIPENTSATTYHNSVISLGTSPKQTYRKNHLVPFSEFIPFKWLIGWIYDDLLNMPLADFTAGGADQKPFSVAGQKVAMTNCYEDLFGEELIQQLPTATLLANVSNDAWFGHSWGPQQHLQISQMRALETGRYMLRATNTGVTAIIDQHGRVLRRVPEFTTVSLDGMAQGYRGATPYVRFGNQVVVYLCIALLAVGVFFHRRAPSAETS